MVSLALELVLAPALVGGSTLACRRWNERIGGLLSAFPAVVGPVLLITAQERGVVFAARAANGTLLGAESDLQQLTQIARSMVGRWGMSEKVGPLTVLPSDGQGPLLPGASETSLQTQWLSDEEVRRIVDDAHDEATQLLTEHREQRDNLAHALLKAETLDADDAYSAAGVSLRTADMEPAASA